ncbi:MAG: phosphoribosylglycinamide formyltransferase [Bacteroidetes bacterium]|nr:phosphoribosylglycinamide formyltransferase [Bacteroidota bacterium]MBK9353409.1 phosphoribosylglycinamide formyltransferase [Bacteroidota bacterium]
MKEKVNLSIFISGGGSNAIQIIEFFKDNKQINIACLLSNNQQSGAEKIGKTYEIPYFIFSKLDWEIQHPIEKYLEEKSVDLIILAGFLKLIPKSLIHLFPNKIINIHPALLPKYGGKGMYGHHVHQAVKNAKETTSGITIHLVSEIYDEGPILFQKKCKINESDDAALIGKKVLELEHKYFSQVIENYIFKEF